MGITGQESTAAQISRSAAKPASTSAWPASESAKSWSSRSPYLRSITVAANAPSPISTFVSRLEIHVRSDDDIARRLQPEHRRGAIRRCEQHRLPFDGLARELARRIPQIEARHDVHLPLARESHLAPVELLRASDDFVRALERDDVARAVAERDRDAGR